VQVKSQKACDRDPASFQHAVPTGTFCNKTVLMASDFRFAHIATLHHFACLYLQLKTIQSLPSGMRESYLLEDSNLANTSRTFQYLSNLSEPKVAKGVAINKKAWPKTVLGYIWIYWKYTQHSKHNNGVSHEVFPMFFVQ